MSEIVFPAEAAERLSIPPIDLFIGTTNNLSEVVVRCSGWTLRKRPKVRLVLVDYQARNARLWKAVAPMLFVANLIAVPLAVVASFLDRVPLTGWGHAGTSVAAVIAFMVVTGSLLVRQQRRPESYPLLVTGRRVLMAALPPDVAKEWVAQNPGVVQIFNGRLAPRGFHRWVYAVTALPFVILTLALIATAGTQHRDDYFPPAITAFGLFAVAVVLVAMSLPTRRR